jgi:hypothetical protein
LSLELKANCSKHQQHGESAIKHRQLTEESTLNAKQPFYYSVQDAHRFNGVFRSLSLANTKEHKVRVLSGTARADKLHSSTRSSAKVKLTTVKVVVKKQKVLITCSGIVGAAELRDAMAK